MHRNSNFKDNSSKNFDKLQPIEKTIIPQKHALRYLMHRYFTRRPFNVVQAYIEHFTNEGDIVLDSFAGTGVTAIESLILRRKAIAVDIAPLSSFITKMIAISPINLEEFDKAFKEIEKRVKKEINDLYSKSEREIEKMKVPYWYPKEIKLPKNADVETVEQLFTKRQLIALSILLNQIKKIKDKKIKELILFTFSATLTFTNRMYDRGSSSPFAVSRYWMPKKLQELNVWEYFTRRYKAVKKGKEETNSLIGDFYKEKETFFCYTQSATNLKNIKDNSIDYIFIDPPYGGNIAYLDLSAMWNAWLDFEVEEEDKKLEVIEGGDLDKTLDDYKDLLYKSLKECHRVLKLNRWMSVVFHHKNLELWKAVVNSCKKVGFEYLNTVVQPTDFKTLHKIQSPLKNLAGELILNFKKSENPSEESASYIPNIKSLILNTAERVILKNDGATIDDIYMAIIPELINAGLLDIAVKDVNDLTPILKKEFLLNSDGKWHLKEGIKLGSYIPLEHRARFYIESHLKRVKKATIDEIYLTLLPNLANGKEPEKTQVLKILEEIAEPTENNKWKIKPKRTMQIKISEQFIQTKELQEVSKSQST